MSFYVRAYPHEKSEKKGQCQKLNFSQKDMSFYSVFCHLNHFFNQFAVLGLFLIILVLALERKIAKMDVDDDFFLPF